MKQTGVARLGIIIALLAVPAAGWAGVTEQARDSDILAVTGRGEVRVAPNVAMARLGVEVLADTAAPAIAENNRIMTRVVEAIRKLNIPERNIQTAMFTVSRQFEPRPIRDQPQRQVFVVSNIVSVRLEDVNRTGAVIDAGAQAGANVIHGITFLVEREQEAYHEALRLAIEEGQGKAQAIAKALQLRIVGVESVAEAGAPMVAHPMREMAAFALDRAAAPILPGENVVRADVVVRYRIQR